MKSGDVHWEETYNMPFANRAPTFPCPLRVDPTELNLKKFTSILSYDVDGN
jgi:hypothetical protein